MRLPFFRSKKNSADPRAQPPRGAASAGVDGSSVQAARTRARRRLIGALVLLAAGVVGFPLLFETQPRPLPVDTPIFVPVATSTRLTPAPTVRPLPAVPPDAGNEPVVVAASAPLRPANVAVAATSSGPAPAAKALPTAAQAAASVAAPSTRGATPASTPAARPTVAPAAAPALASAPAVTQVPEPQPPRSEAGKPVKPDSETAAPAGGRFVVQVGAYNDPERLRAARQKVEKLGYKTYTQDVDSPTGKRTRVSSAHSLADRRLTQWLTRSRPAACRPTSWRCDP